MANDTAKATIYLDSKQAESAIDILKAKAADLRKELKKAQDAGDNIKMNKLSGELTKVDSALSGIRKESFDVQKVLKDLNGSSMNDLKKALGQTQKEYNRMKQTDAGYKDKKAEVDKLKNAISEANGTMKDSGTTWDKLKDTASGLLPAFGFAAIAAGAAAAFGKIINITDTLGTQWEASVNGMKEGLNEFWRTIATGDWSNFTTRMQEAIAMGEKYIYTLDDIEDKTRSLDIIEAESRGKILDLEEKLRNKTLSKEERIAAGQERIKMEEDLAVRRTGLAQQTYDNEAELTALQTGLSKEQLKTVLSDMDSVTKIRAKAYNDQLDQYEKLKKANVTTVGNNGMSGGIVVALGETDKMIELKKLFQEAAPATKLYADQIRATGNTTDEQLDKMVGSYVKLKEAENSAKENTKRVVTQTNSLLAGQEETGEKIENKSVKNKKDASDKALEILDTANNERNKKLADQYLNENMTDATFKAAQFKLETDYLIAKQIILQKNGQSTVDIDKQINDKRIQSQKEFNDAMAKAEEETLTKNDPLSGDEVGVDPASMVTPEDIEFASKKHSLDEWVEYLTQKTNEQLDIKKKAIDDEKAMQEAREQINDAQMSGIGQLAGVMAGMFEEGSAAQIAFFALEKAMAIAQVWVNYARESSAIHFMAATMGVPGIAWEAVMQPKALINAGINTAIITAQAVAQVVGSKKSKKEAGHVVGGFTGPGGKYDEKGPVHANEYVIPMEGTQAAGIRPFIDLMEIARRNGSLARLDLRPVVQAMASGNGYSSGGHAVKGSSSGSGVQVNNQSSLSGITFEELKRFNDIMNRLDKNGIKASINKYGVNGLDEGIKDIAKFNAKIFKK